MNLNEHEIRDEREVYGHDKRAINRHSVRVYKVPGHDDKIYLNRTLDGCPPFFELYTFPNAAFNEQQGRVTFSQRIKVKGKEHWGSGLSWPKAIELAGGAIEAWFAEVAG